MQLAPVVDGADSFSRSVGLAVIAMATKRGTGEGNVYKRSDGRWVGRLSLGFDQDGKRLRKVVYGLTQKEVNGKLDNLKQQRKHGAKSIVGKDTLAGYLQRWLDDDVAINLEDNTFDEYERCCRLYINPFIGHIKLKDLTSEHLIGWQAKLSRKKFSANMRVTWNQDADERTVPCRGIAVDTIRSMCCIEQTESDPERDDSART